MSDGYCCGPAGRSNVRVGLRRVVRRPRRRPAHVDFSKRGSPANDVRCSLRPEGDVHAGSRDSSVFQSGGSIERGVGLPRADRRRDNRELVFGVEAEPGDVGEILLVTVTELKLMDHAVFR